MHRELFGHLMHIISTLSFFSIQTYSPYFSFLLYFSLSSLFFFITGDFFSNSRVSLTKLQTRISLTSIVHHPFKHLSKASGHPQFTSRTKILSIGLVPELVLRLGAVLVLKSAFMALLCGYERYIFALEEASRDVLSTLKDKALKTIYALLKSKSEQERRDPENKAASNADYLLSKLLSDHPNMKVNFLSQVRLSHYGDGAKVAKRLVEVYFALFKLLIS
ncbi:hypothetical protein HanRHA438_Chr04g0194291 [Helianthus annuus]|nr:hypothetical protein HanRHA438_Chr04g0194291 [Helianthus annuus]